MRHEDLTGLCGRHRGRIAALLAVIASAPGLAACGGDEPTQTTAPAETGAVTTESETDMAAGEPGAEPDGGEQAQPMDNEAAIVATLEAVLADDDAKKACDGAVTERFLRRAYGDSAGCEATFANAKPANDAGVRQVVITPGSVAQALARPQGGLYDGQKLRAELILDEDAWKLDSLRSNVPVGP